MTIQALVARTAAYLSFAAFAAAGIAGCDVTQHFEAQKPLVEVENASNH